MTAVGQKQTPLDYAVLTHITGPALGRGMTRGVRVATALGLAVLLMAVSWLNISGAPTAWFPMNAVGRPSLRRDRRFLRLVRPPRSELPDDPSHR